MSSEYFIPALVVGKSGFSSTLPTMKWFALSRIRQCHEALASVVIFGRFDARRVALSRSAGFAAGTDRRGVPITAAIRSIPFGWLIVTPLCLVGSSVFGRLWVITARSARSCSINRFCRMLKFSSAVNAYPTSSSLLLHGPYKELI